MFPFDDPLGHFGLCGVDGFGDEVNFHCRGPVVCCHIFRASMSAPIYHSKMHARIIFSVFFS
jgi:hypothetical protein